MISLCQIRSGLGQEHPEWIGEFVRDRTYSIGNYLEILVIDTFKKITTEGKMPDGTPFYYGETPIDILFSSERHVLHEFLRFPLRVGGSLLMTLLPGKYYILTAAKLSDREHTWYMTEAKCIPSH